MSEPTEAWPEYLAEGTRGLVNDPADAECLVAISRAIWKHTCSGRWMEVIINLGNAGTFEWKGNHFE